MLNGEPHIKWGKEIIYIDQSGGKLIIVKITICEHTNFSNKKFVYNLLEIDVCIGNYGINWNSS